MRYCVAVTHKPWFTHLAASRPDEVNFWLPSPRRAFRGLELGHPLLFKLHYPDNFIAGGGFLVKYDALPLSLAWDAFGERNGAPDLESLRDDIAGYKRRRGERTSADPVIGCIVLSDPFFLTETDWIPAPSDWSRNIVTWKGYDTDESIGAELWQRVSDLLLVYRSELGEELLKEAAASPQSDFGGLYLRRARLGQGAFRVMVTSAYQHRCAVSGERVLPVLEAAHIKPHNKTGPNVVANGLLLRRDIHRLFDLGYVTVQPDLVVQVSKAVRREFENGREYYAFHGKRLTQLPGAAAERPARNYLEWHNERVYMSR